VVGTYRAAEVVVREHPLQTMKHELVQQGRAVEVALSYLSPAAVHAYVAVRVADHDAAAVLAPVVYRRTDGHPFFMVQVTDYLVQAGEPLLTPTVLVALERALPQGLRALIEAQLGQLAAAEQRVLEGCSVAGAEFAAASVAAGSQMEPAAVEAACEALARQRRFLEDHGLVEWPDGTVSGRYGWRHALYQEVVYQRLGAVRQRRWHRRVGARLEQAYGERVHEVAAELALHFERGQDPWRAVQYLRQAADNAVRRHAPYEAITLLTTGLALLATLPETSARAQQELAMQWALAIPLSDVKGPADSEVGQTLARVRALCAQVGETPQLLLMVMGFYWFHVLRGALSTAQELGEEMARLAQRTARPADLLLAHDALGYAGFLKGDYGTAQMHCTQAMAWLDPLTMWEQVADYGYVPGVYCLSTSANVLWCLGFPSQAVQRSQEAIALAQASGDPMSLAFTQLYAAYLHQRRREVLAVQTHAEALLTLATAHGFAHHVAYGTFWRGWALARQGQQAAGLAQMSQGLDDLVATGSLVARPLCLSQLAEATGHAGDVDAGLRLLAEAMEACTTGERGDGLAEAHRLKGELLLQGNGIVQAAEAAACFEQALSIARRQQAKSWELRAAMSLSRLRQQQGKRADAYALLEPVYAWFTEGFDTADLQEARALLEVLA
jgi:adenylate cyclase